MPQAAGKKNDANIMIVFDYVKTRNNLVKCFDIPTNILHCSLVFTATLMVISNKPINRSHRVLSKGSGWASFFIAKP